MSQAIISAHESNVYHYTADYIAPVVELVDNRPAVTSLQIAKHFEKDHRHVMRDIRRIITEIPVDFGVSNFGQSAYINEQGKEQPMYNVFQDGFVILGMGYTGAKAMKMKLAYIAAFNAMREQLAKPDMPDFTNPVLAARAWADAQEAKQLAEQQMLALEAQAAIDRPKVIFADAVDASPDSVLIREIATVLKQNAINIGQNRLFQWMRHHGFLMNSGESRNLPTQKSMNMGLFEIKERIIQNPDGSSRLTRTPFVTGKGQLYFVNKFLNCQETLQ